MYQPPFGQLNQEIATQEIARRNKHLINEQQFIPYEHSTSRGKYLLLLGLTAFFVLAITIAAFFLLH